MRGRGEALAQQWGCAPVYHFSPGAALRPYPGAARPLLLPA